MKLKEYLKNSKNRMTLIYINVAMSILLSIAAVAVDEQYGSAGLSCIYIMQAVCYVNWLISFSLLVWNISSKINRKNKDKIINKGNRLK